MASRLYLILLIVLAVLCCSSLSANNLSPTDPICDSTPYPSFCRTTLPTNINTSSSNVYDYGRVSFRKSISAAREFLSLINYYLTRSPQTLSVTTIRALQDCRFLAEQNIDFLLNSIQTVDNTQTILSTTAADDVQSTVSAILTNTQTCWDGLTVSAPDWSESNALYLPLANNTKLYSVSLALFTKAWVPKTKTIPAAGRRKHLTFRHGKNLPFKMSKQNKAIYETIGKRKLLQTSDPDQVIVSNIVVVNQNGTGNFTTINDAVAAAPNNTNGSGGYFLIYITAGVYEEYVSIPSNKRYLMMIGDGINQTILTGNRSVVDGWTTFNSFSFAVVGKGFVAVDITFRNTAGPVKMQAVAARNGADLSTFYSCSFEGYQDTLYAHSQRQFYRECDIYGTVDFIFGNAAAVFQNCNIYPRLPLNKQFNAITAEGRTDPNQITGYSFQNCTIKASADLASSNGTTQTYLGRPWKEYSRTVYMQNFMDSLINPLGWHEWSGDFALNTSYYAEFNNWGPGSNTSGRVTWPGFHVIDASNASSFTVSSFLLGDSWLPQTGVPYTGGLM